MGNNLPMSGVKHFILGFGLSLGSVIMCGQLHRSAPSLEKVPPSQNLEINLYKRVDITAHNLSAEELFVPIKKQSLAIEETTSSLEAKDSTLPSDGIADDEILSIGYDDSVPIEIGASLSENDLGEVLVLDKEDKVALLPGELLADEKFDTHDDIALDDTSWIKNKGKQDIQSKPIMSEISQQAQNNLFTDDFEQTLNEDREFSYKVAEKIKQSIIFPIPDEILNDENLTPTFISNQPKPVNTSTIQNVQPQPVRVVEEPQPIQKNELQLKIVPTQSARAPQETSDKGVLDSISSWFTNKPNVTDNVSTQPVKKQPPSYSSQEQHEAPVFDQTNSDDLAKFYESLQKTREEYNQRRIVPTELKLSFQPDRAEISGSTLHWLKLFSESAIENQSFLQIRLNASTATELQKKRLNLLYTIFMNNGVDFKKVDTVFSLTEPNSFIIRTINPR